MRATIVTSDNKVIVDGESQTVDCSPLVAEGKHAVQWYGDYGEVEFVSTFDPEAMRIDRLPNEIITDFAPYQSYVDAWSVEKAKQEENR
jgi:hypothetical protein